MYKIIEVPDEYVDSHRCKCGGKIIIGLQDPEGDYDDWIQKPICDKCGMKSDSDKRTLEDFVLIESVALRHAWPKDSDGSFGVFRADATKESIAKRYQRFGPDDIVFGPAVEPLENESEYEHEQRTRKSGDHC